LTSSSPCRKRSEPGSIRACADAAVPDRRWQRVQWQYVIETGGSASSNRTPPQRHPPVDMTRRIFTAISQQRHTVLSPRSGTMEA